jgi:transcription elongation factor GreA
MSEEKYLTKAGLEKVKKEVEYLKTVKRKEISERIAEAIKLGDLSENAEYHEAKDDQGLNEARVRELEEILHNAVLITNGTNKKKNVEVGTTIKVQVNNSEKEFTIVGPSEANPANGLISNESPIGQAFIGKKLGDIAEVEAPAGIIKYKILSIE